MQKFSRADLQNHKFEMIRKKASEFVRQYYSSILMNAQCGKTSYTLNYDAALHINSMTGHLIPVGQEGPPPEPTLEDILDAFREQFPDCSVEYAETWVDVPASKHQPPTKVLRKGIHIDWS